MAKSKQLTLEQLYEQVTGLPTNEQKLLKEFIAKTLEDKAQQAKETLELIGDGK